MNLSKNLSTLNKFIYSYYFHIILFLFLLVTAYHFGFINGYKDSERDMINNGYTFNNTPRAFK